MKQIIMTIISMLTFNAYAAVSLNNYTIEDFKHIWQIKIGEDCDEVLERVGSAAEKFGEYNYFIVSPEEDATRIHMTCDKDTWEVIRLRLPFDYDHYLDSEEAGSYDKKLELFDNFVPRHKFNRLFKTTPYRVIELEDENAEFLAWDLDGKTGVTVMMYKNKVAEMGLFSMGIEKTWYSRYNPVDL